MTQRCNVWYRYARFAVSTKPKVHSEVAAVCFCEKIKIIYQATRYHIPKETSKTKSLSARIFPRQI